VTTGRAGGPGEEARARVALSRLAEPGDAALGGLVAELGAPEVLRRVVDGSLACSRLSHYRARLGSLDTDLDLEVAARAGVRLLVPGDAEWPAALTDLGPKAPLLLWAAGSADLASAARRSVAVVGARACTPYGEHVGADLGAGLADRGWTVVSGGAFGVDAAAHRGALAVDGETVAVLACGVDIAYPAAHEGLLASVRRSGLVVSELPPSARPTRSRFLERNRLIAALGRGTVVVEAAIRSGARSTASKADELSRPVMAVPGPVTSALSAGCHQLIRECGAALVTDAADVLDLVGELGVDAAAERRGPQRPEDGLDPLTLRVLEALPLRRWARPDAVGVVAGVDAPTVLRGLALLAGAGLAESRDGAWRRAGPTRV
jgi:DNA processing protein